MPLEAEVEPDVDVVDVDEDDPLEVEVEEVEDADPDEELLLDEDELEVQVAAALVPWSATIMVQRNCAGEPRSKSAQSRTTVCGRTRCVASLFSKKLVAATTLRRGSPMGYAVTWTFAVVESASLLETEPRATQ